MSIHEKHAIKTTDETNAEKREMEKDCIDCPERLESLLNKQAHFSKPKQDFNGGYIKASQEAKKLLEENGKKIEFNYQTIPDNDVHFLVSENGKNFIKVNKDQLYEDQKQFYINNGALSWEEPIGENLKFCKEQLKKSLGLDLDNTNSMENEAPIEELYEEALCRGEGYLDFSDDLKAYHDRNNSKPQINSMEDLNELSTVQEEENFAETYNDSCKENEEKEKQEQQKRYLEILMYQLQAMECNLKVMRELNKVGGLKLDLSALEHEIVVIQETIEELGD